MKKILFFATMFVVVLCSTALISCSKDDPKEDDKGYPYSIELQLTPDVLAAYEDVTITVQIPGGPETTTKMVGRTYTASGVAPQYGVVNITFNGKLRADIEDDRMYTLGFYSIIKMGTRTDINELLRDRKGSALKENNQELSTFPTMSYSHDFDIKQ